VRNATDDELGLLERLRDAYGDDPATAEKLRLLKRLERRRLPGADDVDRLHEALCFLRAYPDGAEILRQVERMLAGFPERSDLRKHRAALVNSGIAGTTIDYRFFWYTAAWISRRWPGRLTIDWAELTNRELLDRRLSRLMPFAENLALGETGLPLVEWIRRLKGPGETDGDFLIRRFEPLRAEEFLRESYYHELDIPYRLAPGPDTPSRTHARYAPSPVAFQARPPVRSRRAFRPAIARPPLAVRSVPPLKARVLIDLAREAMVTRERDLDAFVHADERDVRLVEFGDGLQFACYGTTPERRQMLDAVYGFLVLMNGVPTGYVLSASLLGSTEIAYNIFDTYRGTEAARLFGVTVAMVRHLFGSDTFVLDPYQLGHDNQEGLKSGAWWFYYKLGFRPKDRETKHRVRDELKKMRAKPGRRSPISTLQALSETEMFLHLARTRDDVIGLFSRENVGFRIMKYLAERFGSERERGIRTCSREAAELLGVRSFSSFSKGERLAWERWSPLVLVLPGLERWSRGDRAALVRVVRAKGGRRESDFVRLFDGHRRLRRAIVKLSQSDPFESD